MADNDGLSYFGHPYTVKGPDGRYIAEGEDANFRICCWRSAELMKRGFNIYSPICHTHPIHRACPEFLARYEHEMWYRLDMEFIQHTDFARIILAPLWGNSKGCVNEKRWFEEAGKPVLFYEEIMQETKGVPSDEEWDAQREQSTKKHMHLPTDHIVDDNKKVIGEPQAGLPPTDEQQPVRYKVEGQVESEQCQQET